VILYSVDFHDIEQLQRAGDWQAAGALLSTAACALETAGADFLVLCTNTMHKVAPAIEAAVRIPLLHIADPTAAEIKRAGFTQVGLLGTRFTMDEAFMKERLSRDGLQILTPARRDRESVDRIIYEELCQGLLAEASRAQYRSIIARLVERGAQAIILGCTEISLLIEQKDAAVPLFDTTSLHAREAGLWAL
jgi:aspartate racemase